MKLPTTKIGWLLLIVAVLVLMTAIADQVHADTEVGVHGGHWSKHLSSDDFTNEEHAWLGVRVGPVTFGKFDNSYKQKDFDGETWYIGAIGDFMVGENVNRWHGDVILRGSVGMMHGYTSFGGHDPEKDAQWYPYAAFGLLYQQPLNDTIYWEAGGTMFGDALLPSAGIGARF